MALRIISRAEWGARDPKRSVTTTSWSKRIGMAFHYSDGNKYATPRDLQAYAQDTLDYADTHYNFFTDYKGRAYEGRGWLVVAAHAKDQNTPWIGTCFIGREGDVTDAALYTMRALWEEGNRLKGSTLAYSGHGQLPGQSTNCPGNTIKSWLTRGIPYPSGVSLPEVDNVWCKKSDKGDNVLDLQIRLVDIGVHVGPDGKTAPADNLYKWCDGDYGSWTSRAVGSVSGDNGETFGPWQNRALKMRERVSSAIPTHAKLVIPSIEVTAQLTP